MRVTGGEIQGSQRDRVRAEVLSAGHDGRKVCIVSCGPGSMADQIRTAVVGCVGKGWMLI